MAAENQGGSKQDRRVFLAQLGGAVVGGVAILNLPGCETAPGDAVAPEDGDFEMHGPIEMATEELQQPLQPSAMALFAPYDDGTPFSGHWAVGHAIRGKQDQVRVVLVDTETGGHAELDLYRRELAIQPIAASALFGFYLDNDGRGDVKTPRHLERLAQRLAEIVTATEAFVEVAWEVPTMRAASELRRQQLEAMRSKPTLSGDAPQTMAEAALLLE
ncbi:MAG: hypothetical protein R3F39_21430 [Myxococcota bacterium]